MPSIGDNRPFVCLCRNSKLLAGFTLVELMITLVIIAIVAGLAVPNFRSTIQNQRLVSQNNALVADLSYARSEATKRGGNVGICTGSGAACVAAGDWKDGRLIFWDQDNDGAWSVGDEVLRVREALEGGNTLTSGAAGDLMLFDRTGLLSTGAVDYALCDDRGNVFGKKIVVNASGQVRFDGAPGAC